MVKTVIAIIILVIALVLVGFWMNKSEVPGGNATTTPVTEGTFQTL